MSGSYLRKLQRIKAKKNYDARDKVEEKLIVECADAFNVLIWKGKIPASFEYTFFRTQGGTLKVRLFHPVDGPNGMEETQVTVTDPKELILAAQNEKRVIELNPHKQ
jgi:hypothetical protein